MGAQNEATKRYLAKAVSDLEAAQKHVSEGMKNSGKAWHASVRQAPADARGAAEQVSEAVATNRVAASSQSPK